MTWIFTAETLLRPGDYTDLVVPGWGAVGVVRVDTLSPVLLAWAIDQAGHLAINPLGLRPIAVESLTVGAHIDRSHSFARQWQRNHPFNI